LAAIERAARNPSIRTIVKLATAFRVPFTVLFDPIPLQTEALERRDVAKRKRERR
jgi:transcriptional regulator with XRE-family HTH domain